MSLKREGSIYVAPYSPMSLAFTNYLTQQGLHVKGYIDSYKEADKVFKPTEVLLKTNESIFILSPNHTLSIYDSLSKIFPKKNVKIFQLNEGFYNKKSYLSLVFSEKIKTLFSSICSFVIHHLKSHMISDKHILCIAPDFIDNNIKDFFLYVDQYTDYRVCIATNNKEHYSIFKKQNLNAYYLPSLRYFWWTLRAKFVILDHTPLSQWVIMSFHKSKVIQLWHGIPLKRLSPSVNGSGIIYDKVVSTSSLVTNIAFEQVFTTNQFITTGYPRNDLFLTPSLLQYQEILANQEIMNFLMYKNERIIIYMPTYRENGFQSNPIDFEELNHFAKKNSLLFVVKLHPFHSLGQFDSLELNKYIYTAGYQENIVVYPENNDIYPILRLSSLLITDYSSIYFDYLFVNKPILFFVYDKEEYSTIRGDFMLNFDDFTPGAKCKTFLDLQTEVCNQLTSDNWAENRLDLRKKLFSNSDVIASQLIIKEIENL